jgi:hypothetical protein
LGYAQSVNLEDIVFDQSTIDLGFMDSEDDPKKVAFTFVNKGENAFVINKVTTSCGCTKPTYNQHPILPNQRGVVTITFNPQGMFGDISKAISIFGNFNDGIKKQLRIKVNVSNEHARKNTPEIYAGQFGYVRLLTPVLGLDTITTREGASGTLVLYNEGQKAYRVTGFESVPEYVSVQNKPELQPGDTAHIHFTVAPTDRDLLGLSQIQFWILTNDRFYQKKEVRMAYFLIHDEKRSRREMRRRPVIETSPNVVDLGVIRQGGKKTGSFTITNSGRSPLQILHLKTHCSCTVVGNYPEFVPPGESVEIAVEFDSLFKKGRQVKHVEIYSNDPKKPFVQVSVRAQVQEL